MSLQVEKLENNMAKLTIEVSAEEFDAAVEKAYIKNKGQISVPGFRKGKVPRKMIEKMYGEEVFFEDAANIIIPDAYEKAYDDCEEEIVSSPKIDVVQLEAGKPFIFTAEVALKPEVTLGKYKGVEVKKATIEVTDEEIDAEIDKERKNSARTITVDNRAVQDGDVVTIDFEGFVNDVPFEGGKGEDYPLTIGSHSFIDNFEEQIIGKNIGDTFDVNVTFPEDYQAENLKGQPAKFVVTVKEIKENQLPELDDEFAEEVSAYSTFAEYKDSIRKNLTEKKENEAKNEKEEAVIDAIVADAKMDVPDAMIMTTQRQMVEDFAQRLSMQGMNMQQYFQFTGQTEETMLEQIKPQAERRVKSRLVLEAVVATEDITVSDAEYDEEIQKLADAYSMEVEKIKEILNDDKAVEMKLDIAVRKAADFVIENAVEN